MANYRIGEICRFNPCKYCRQESVNCDRTTCQFPVGDIFVKILDYCINGNLNVRILRETCPIIVFPGELTKLTPIERLALFERDELIEAP